MDKCPPGQEDFPEVFHDAINVFNMMGDRVYPDVGFIGKDYTNLPFILEAFQIERSPLFLEVLSRLDHTAIKESQDALKRQYDKIKRSK